MGVVPLAGCLLLWRVQPFLAITNRVDARVLAVEGWVHEYAIRAGAATGLTVTVNVRAMRGETVIFVVARPKNSYPITRNRPESRARGLLRSELYDESCDFMRRFGHAFA